MLRTYPIRFLTLMLLLSVPARADDGTVTLSVESDFAVSRPISFMIDVGWRSPGCQGT